MTKIAGDNYDSLDFENFQFRALKDFTYIVKYLLKNINSLASLNMKFEMVVRDILFSNEKYVNDISYIVAKLEEQESNSTATNTIYFELTCDIKGRFNPSHHMFVLIKIYNNKQWRLLRKTKDTPYDNSISLGRFGVKSRLFLNSANIEKKEFDKKIKLEVYRKVKKMNKLCEFDFDLKKIILDKEIQFDYYHSRCFFSTKYDFSVSYLH